MKKIIKLLKKSQKIALFSHISPDPDTIGSTMALFYVLKAMKKDVYLFCDDEHIDKFSFLDADKLYNMANLSENFDAFIAVDISSLDRVGEKFAEIFDGFKNTIKIDHHKAGDDFAKINLMKPYSACAILIYEIITKLKIKINPQIATLLYFAICGDTGGFRYTNTDALTFEICAKLLGCGADIRWIYAEFFDKKTVPSLKLSSFALMNAKLDDELGYALMTIKNDDYKKFEADESEYIGNLPNLYLNCGYKIAVIIKEKSDGVKASLRSKFEYDCSIIAQKFGGGGHKNASGISFDKEISLLDAQKDIEVQLRDYLKNFESLKEKN